MSSRGFTKTVMMLVTAIMLVTRSFVTSPAECICLAVLNESDTGVDGDDSAAGGSSAQSCCNQSKRCCPLPGADCHCGCHKDGPEQPFSPGERNERSDNRIVIADAPCTSVGVLPGHDHKNILRESTSAGCFAFVPVRVRCCVWQT